MIYRRLSLFVLFCVLYTLYPEDSHSLSVGTHEQIDFDVASKNISGFSLDSYLRNYTLFYEGIYERFSSQNVRIWLTVGGRQEDKPSWCLPYITRSVNHFHNPLTDNGFSGYVEARFFSGDSALRWAQYPVGTQSSIWCGDFSWFDVRDYFYNALTSTTDTARDNYFSKTFRGVGQLMHLVQDMSVPEHARDQGHILDAYEEWVNKNLGNPDSVYKYANNNPFYPSDTLLNSQSAFGTAPISIANLFDTNQYDGTNPDITISNNVGLSEYTNANFVSKATVFTSSFPYPAASNMIGYKDPSTNKPYLSKVGAGDNIVHFLRTNEYYPKLPANYKNIAMELDNKVYEDYAQRLLPRGIGYSASLLKYFFRGALEISRPPENIYAVIDGSIVPQQFTKLKMRIRNGTPYDNLVNGMFQAVARYRRRTNYQPDLSADPPLEGSREAFFSYSVSPPVYMDGPLISKTWDPDNTSYVDVLFDFASSPIPAGITDLNLTVAYKGTIGNEPDVAVAAGSKDLMEPAHHVYFNLTDMYSLDDHLYTASEIRSDPAKLSRVGSSYFDPYSMTLAISYVNQAPPMPIVTPEIDIAVANLSPGQHFKLIVLVDNNNYIRATETDNVDPGYDVRYGAYTGLRNQSYGGNWTSTDNQVLLFRHDAAGNTVRNNYYTGWLRCTPYEGGCPYPESEAYVDLPSVLPVQVQLLGDFATDPNP